MAVALGAHRECAMSEQVSQTTAPFWTEREQTAQGRAGRVTQNERKKKEFNAGGGGGGGGGVLVR